VPILDVAWVIYRRLAQGRSPFRGGDGQHLPHRLRLLGMSDRKIVLSVYAVCGAVGLAVLSMHSVMPTMQKAFLLAIVVVGVSTGIAVIARLASRAALHNEPDSAADVHARPMPPAH
jgi:UDP-GlcNAc:undecaprenyl-phosphate GlcNAc-1-phosphate transferase